MERGVLVLMVFLPIYIFWYSNHFNRFYVIFFIIDITQTLYFYRFLNIRWAINGIKFFKNLRPTVSFYMWNFYYQDLSDKEFELVKSGVYKFDKERESSLFMNNTGSLMSLFFIYLGCYFLVVLFTQKRLYKKEPEKKLLYRVMWQVRHGYFEWGIWFDSIMASSGVFIIYVFLQLTNPKPDPINSFIAMGVGTFYFGFFISTLMYTYKNEH